MNRKSELMIEEALQWLRSDTLGFTKVMKENFKELYMAYDKLKNENETLHFILTEAAAVGMQRKDKEPKITQDRND